MKNLKFGVLAFGVLGLIALFMMDIIQGLKHDAVNAIMVILGFALPTAMGAMALKKPFLRWMGAVALAGFALVAIKLRIWDMLKVISLVPTSIKLAIVACIGGIVVSIITLAKPEAE